MSDPSTHKKDLAELHKELQLADQKETIDIAQKEVAHAQQKAMFDEVPQHSKHENWKGRHVIRHTDYNHQQQPGGNMRGK